MAGDGRSKSSQAKELGQRGGKSGGPARAKKLTSQERSRIAAKGGAAKAKNKKK
jgi:hypothetical protein